MNRKMIYGLVFVLTMTFAACSGGGGGGGNSTGEHLAGVFLDSAVEGLSYTTSPGGLRGKTSSNGGFNYKAGDSVSFVIGDVVLGGALGKSQVTPLDFDDTDPEDGYSNRVINTVRLLQTLDEDDNADNGIQLPDNIDVLGAGLTLNMDQAVSAFANDASVETLCDGKVLVSQSDALDHFESTLLSISINVLKGFYSLYNSSVTDSQGNDMLTGTDYSGTMTIEDNGRLIQNFTVNGNPVQVSGTVEIYNHYQIYTSSAGCIYLLNYNYDEATERFTTKLDLSDLTFDGSETIGSCLGVSPYYWYSETDVWQKATDSASEDKGVYYGDYAVTELAYDDDSDWDQEVEDVFGSGYRVADWNDLKAYDNNGGDLLDLFDGLGLSEYDDSVYVKNNGDPSYSSTRYYFATRHEGHLPTSYNYLAHDNIGNYTISLGSWYGSNRILAIKISSSPDTPSELTMSSLSGDWAIAIEGSNYDTSTYYIIVNLSSNGTLTYEEHYQGALIGSDSGTWSYNSGSRYFYASGDGELCRGTLPADATINDFSVSGTFYGESSVTYKWTR